MKNLKLFLFTLVALFVVGFAVNVNAEGTDISGATISGISTNYVYTGEPITPVPTTVKLSGVTLVQDTDYTLSYENNVNLTTDESKAKVIVTGIGEYEGTVEKTFNIKEAVYSLNGVEKADNFPTAFNDGTYKLLKDVTMTTNRIAMGTFASNVTLDLNGHTLAFPGNASYSTLLLGRTSGQTLNIVGPGTIVDNNDVAVSIIGITGKNYTVNVGEGVKLIGTTGIMFDKNTSGNKVTFAGEIESSSYSLYANGELTDLENGNEFIISGKAVAQDGPGIYAAGYAKWTVSGEVTGDSGIEIRAGEMTVLDGAKITGTAVTTTAVPNGNGTTTTGAGIAVSQHTTVLPIDVEVQGGTITGATPFYEVITHENGDASIIDLSITGGNFVRADGSNYSIINSANKTGFVTGGTYNVTPDVQYLDNDYSVYHVNDKYVVDVTLSSVSAGEDINLAYGESAKIVPTANPEDSNTGFTFASSDETVATVDSEGNVTALKVGIATITVTSTYDSTKTATVTVTVTALDISDAVVVGAEDKVYNGTAQEQSDILVTLNGKGLTRNVDYTITYDKNINAGTAEMTVHGMGNYTGSKIKTFKINPADISDFNVDGIEDKVYNGTQQEQTITISKDDVVLTEDDYTVTYGGNVDVGTAGMLIEGKGNYTGTIQKEFKINPVDLSSAKVTGAVVKVYNGYFQKQTALVVTLDGKKLTLGKDYKILYSNNKNIGVAKYSITGIGNYSGKIYKTFSIIPKKATISSVTAGAKKLTVKYKAVTGGVKYQVSYKLKTKTTWKTISSLTKTSYTASKLTSGKYYNVKVRAYKVVNGKTYYGAWSTIKTIRVK